MREGTNTVLASSQSSAGVGAHSRFKVPLAALPPDQRITKSNLQYEKGKRTLRNFQGFASSDELQPSGLMGPVTLQWY